MCLFSFNMKCYLTNGLVMALSFSLSSLDIIKVYKMQTQETWKQYFFYPFDTMYPPYRDTLKIFEIKYTINQCYQHNFHPFLFLPKHLTSIVCTTFLQGGGRGGGVDRTLIFRGGLVRKRGWPFWGGWGRIFM